MIGIDIGHYGNGRRQLEERAIGFVRLGDQVLALAELGIGAESIEAPADHRGRVDAAMGQDRRHHAGGGGLAVGAGDGDPIFHPHQFGQHFGTRDDGDQPAVGFEDFGVVGPHRGRGHHHVDVGEVLAAVAITDRSAQLTEAPGDLALFEVGTGHLVAEIDEHLGDAAHADAADADEVDFADLAEHGCSSGRLGHGPAFGEQAGRSAALRQTAR